MDNQILNKEKYERMTTDLDKKLKGMTDGQRIQWLKKKSKKFTRKMLAKCLK